MVVKVLQLPDYQGRIVRPFAPELEHIYGRPLGRFDKKNGDLYIVNAYLGLKVVGSTGGLATEVVKEAEENIRRNSEGQFWVALHAKSSPSGKWVCSKWWTGKALLKIGFNFKQLHSSFAGASYTWRGIKAGDAIRYGFKCRIGDGTTSLWYEDQSKDGFICHVVPLCFIFGLDMNICLLDLMIDAGGFGNGDNRVFEEEVLNILHVLTLRQIHFLNKDIILFLFDKGDRDSTLPRLRP
ncbi:hypothetical protein VNO78_10166 [Psophocarpus tetragonolobus]|uniref:Uncharacterized protein n=1 Tax=Psophocarpus tetragonolobus TaxID=3891 RepID=A0AAN9SLV0_PSOTE